MSNLLIAGASRNFDFASGYVESFGQRKSLLGTDGPTLSRTTPGQAFARNGYVKAFDPLAARYQHEPITGRSRGLLVEAYAKRATTYPTDATNAAFTKFGLTASAAGFGVGLDGTGRPVNVLETTANSQHVLSTSGPAIGGAVHTAMMIVSMVGVRSQFLYRLLDDADPSGNRALVYFDLALGVIVNAAVGTGGIVPLGQGKYLVWIVGTLAANAQTAQSTWLHLTNDYQGSFAGDPASGCRIWYADIRTGNGPTSPILATPAAPTERTYDDPTLPIGPWYGPIEGTILLDCEFGYGGDAGTAVVLQGSATEYIRIARDPTYSLIVCEMASGGVYRAVYPGIVRAPGRLRVAFTYRQNRLAAYAAGGTLEVFEGTVSVPAVNIVGLGWFPITGSGHINGAIAQVAFLPFALADSELASIVLNG